MDHNGFTFVGRLTKNPEYFPPGRKGQEHCSFTVAVNRVVPNGEGPIADYIPCSLWGPEAKVFAETMQKGDELYGKGSIRTNFVPQADGKKRFFMEVRVSKVSYGRKSKKNLAPKPLVDATTEAVRKLSMEFGENNE